MNRWFAVVSLALLAFGQIGLAAPPKVNSFFPLGGQRGQTVVLKAAGEFGSWPVQFACDREEITATAENDKGKVKLSIPADATPGIIWLRAFNEEGASGAKPFVIGTLPEAEETEPNDSPEKPQVVADKIVVSGRLAKNGDVDGYRVTLKQGQTLVASLQANSLFSSPMDAVVQICQLVERRGQTEAFVVEQNHDAVGLDPQCVFTASRDGDYLVRVFAFPSEPNSNIGFAGGENYAYRLTITSGGFLDYALPMSAKRGEPSEVKLFGSNLPGEGLAVAVNVPAEGHLSHILAFHADAAGSIPLDVVNHKSIVADGKSSLENPQIVEIPADVSGILSSSGQAAYFAFNASKGMKLRIACESRRLGSPLMAKLRLRDASGKVVATADAEPNKRDPVLNFVAPADGRYMLSVADLHGHGSSRHYYKLSIAEPTADFGLQLAADNFVLMVGQSLEIPVTLTNVENVTSPIELTAENLPAGITCDVVKSSDKPKSGEVVKVMLKASAEASPASAPIRLVGQANGLRQSASALVPPRATPPSSCWLTVRK